MSDREDLLVADRTAPAIESFPLSDQQTRISPDMLATRTGAICSQVGLLAHEATRLSHEAGRHHGKAVGLQMDDRATEMARRPVSDLLASVSEAGFSWVGVARLLGVSVPAIRKWRQGEAVSGPNRGKLAQLVAFVEIVAKDHLVDDVASWMEVPLAGSRATGLDVYAAGSVNELVQYAASHMTTVELLSCAGLDADDSDQRFEVFSAPDGEPAIRPREYAHASAPSTSG